MLLKQFVKWAVMLSAAAVISACASTGPRDGFAADDKYETTSRFFYNGNKRLDTFLIRPTAQAYDLVTPTLVKHLIGNGFSHLDLTNDFANYLLQGDVDRSFETLGRFTLNTLLGAGGLLDPATEFGLPHQNTDFGVTLGKYGVGEGSYLVVPLIGPTTFRDAAGFLVDRAFSPTFYLGEFGVADAVADIAGPALTATQIVHRRDERFDLIDDVLYDSEDGYVTLRAAYLQRRRAQIAGPGNIADTLPDLFDDEAETN